MANKKKYEKPELKTHGNVEKITKGTKGGLGGDGGDYDSST